MKIISPFVDHRDGKRYGPGDYDKVAKPLEADEIERLKKAGCLADGDDTADQPDRKVGQHGISPDRTEMRTEAGEAAHREADARARGRAQQTAAADARPAPKAAPAKADDGLAGRSGPVTQLGTQSGEPKGLKADDSKGSAAADAKK